MAINPSRSLGERRRIISIASFSISVKLMLLFQLKDDTRNVEILRKGTENIVVKKRNYTGAGDGIVNCQKINVRGCSGFVQPRIHFQYS